MTKQVQPIIGYHYAGGGGKGQIGQCISRVNGQGLFICFKGADHAGLCFDAIQSGNKTAVSNSLGWRKVGEDGNGNKWEIPDYSLSPPTAAAVQWGRIKPLLPPELDWSRVWVEHINEPRQEQSPGDSPIWNDMHPVAWCFQYCTEMAKIMNAEGFRALGPAYATGNPPIEALELPEVMEYVRYCAQNPDMAAISVHEYNNFWEDGVTAEQQYPYHYGRFEAIIAAADRAGIPRDYHIKVTEWGWGAESAPGVEQMLQDIDYYQRIITRFWPIVDHVAIWTLQEGWKDIWADVVKLVEKDGGNPLADYIINTRYTVPDEPQRTHADFGGTVPGENPMRDEGEARVPYGRQYWVVDPAMLSAAEIATIYGKASGKLVTIGPSYDDAGIGTGLSSKVAVLWNIPEDEHQTFIDWYAQWYPSTAVDFRRHDDPTTPPDPPTPPQALDVISYNQYDSRWGNDLCGTGPKTLAQWGCLLTAYTDLADYWGINNGRTPKGENAYYLEHGGFSGQNLISMAMSAVYPQVKNEGWLSWATHGQAMHTKAREWLDAGRPVPARVDFNPSTPQWEQHWILLTGYDEENDDYWMNNPWGGGKNVSVKEAYGRGQDTAVLECLFYYLDTPAPQTTDNGLHASADGGDGVGYPSPVVGEFEAMAPQVVKFMSSHSPKMVGTIVSKVKAVCKTYIIRAFQDWGNRDLSVQEFFNGTFNDTLRTVNALRGQGILDEQILIELHNEPNLVQEGLSHSWVDGHSCVSFFYEVLQRYKAQLPDVKYGIGALSPGWQAATRAESTAFLNNMMTHGNWGAFDVVFAHCYTADNWGGPYEIPWIDYIHDNTGKPVWITEASYHTPVDPTTGYPAVIPGNEYAAKLNKLLELLDSRPTLGVTWYAVSASSQTYRHEAFCISNDPQRPYENVNSRGIGSALKAIRG